MTLATIKAAVEIISKPRRAPPVPSLVTRWAFGKEEYEPPKAEDIAQWQRIADYMTAAEPNQLRTARILTGPVPASELVKQIYKHQDEDTFIEDIAGTRQQQAQAIAGAPASAVEQAGPAYFPYAHSVVQNVKSPGALIHELGHAVDLARRERESRLKRWLRWKIKPELWGELSAWKKGRKTYQRGFAASGEYEDPEILKQYQDAMRSYNARKYPAFGTYVGGTSGAVAGGLAGLALAAQLAEGSRRVSGLPIVLGIALGSGAGILGGALGGRLWAKLRAKANARKAMKQLEYFKSAPNAAAIREMLLSLRSERAAGNDKNKAGKKKEVSTHESGSRQPQLQTGAV